MRRISCLEHQGKVLKFDQFVNEHLNVSIKKEDVCLSPDKECFDSCWAIIEQQCGGDVEALMKYLTNEYDIEEPTYKDVLIYIMELVDDYFNKGISFIEGERYIKHGKKADFIQALMDIDYKMCVDDLIRKLFKVDDEENPPQYLGEIMKILNEYLPSIIGGND